MMKNEKNTALEMPLFMIKHSTQHVHACTYNIISPFRTVREGVANGTRPVPVIC